MAKNACTIFSIIQTSTLIQFQIIAAMLKLKPFMSFGNVCEMNAATYFSI